MRGLATKLPKHRCSVLGRQKVENEDSSSPDEEAVVMDVLQGVTLMDDVLLSACGCRHGDALTAWPLIPPHHCTVP